MWCFEEEKPLIGVVHLPPLPGSPHYEGEPLRKVVERAVAEARTLEEAGFDGIMVENYGDVTYATNVAPRETLIALSAILWEVRKVVRVPLGVNVLRNAALDAARLACVLGLDFIRVNALCEHRYSVEGLIKVSPRDLVRVLRSEGCAKRVSVLADVDVKHSSPAASYDYTRVIRDCVLRGGADAVIVTGGATGEAVDPVDLALAKRAGARVLVGSGLSRRNVKLYWDVADGFIVGSSIKRGGMAGNPVDPDEARALASLVRRLRSMRRGAPHGR